MTDWVILREENGELVVDDPGPPTPLRKHQQELEKGYDADDPFDGRLRPVNMNTTLWSPRQEIGKYFGQPAGLAPKAFFELEKRKPDAVLKFLHGLQQKFGTLDKEYTQEDENSAIDKMVEAYQELWDPDLSQFVEHELDIDMPGDQPITVIQNPDHNGATRMLMFGEPKDGMEVRVHSECFYGDSCKSRDCDCGPQLMLTLERLKKHGGVLIYMGGGLHEGRGAGLLAKGFGYSNTEKFGDDTYAAYDRQGLHQDPRTYLHAVDLMKYLKARSGGKLKNITLLSSSQSKARYFKGTVECELNQIEPAKMKAETKNYVLTKRRRGYLVDLGFVANDDGGEQRASTAKPLDAQSVRREILADLARERPLPDRTLADVAEKIQVAKSPSANLLVVGNSIFDALGVSDEEPETNTSDVFHPVGLELGGKGPRFAMAARRYGFDVSMVSRVAEGPIGDLLLGEYKERDIRNDLISRGVKGSDLSSIVLSNEQDGGVRYHMNLPPAGMPSRRDVVNAAGAIEKAKFVYATFDLPLATLEGLVEVADGKPMMAHAAPVRRDIDLIAELGSKIRAFDVLLMNRIEAAEILGVDYRRLNTISNEELADLVRAKSGARATLVTDFGLGVGGSSASGNFSSDAAPGRNRWGTVGAKDEVAATFMAAFSQGETFAESGRVAAEAAARFVKYPSVSFADSLAEPNQLGLRVLSSPPEHLARMSTADAWRWHEMTAAERARRRIRSQVKEARELMFTGRRR